jgi:hypothetical protein
MNSIEQKAAAGNVIFLYPKTKSISDRYPVVTTRIHTTRERDTLYGDPSFTNGLWDKSEINLKTKPIDEAVREALRAQDPYFLYFEERTNWTPKMWGEHLYKTRRNNNWKVLPTKVACSRQWNNLSPAARVAMEQALMETQWVKGKNPKKGSKVVKGSKEVWGEYYDRPICLPYSLLHYKGLKGRDTVSRALKECVEKGFLDKIGEYQPRKLSQYKLSMRWEKM